MNLARFLFENDHLLVLLKNRLVFVLQNMNFTLCAFHGTFSIDLQLFHKAYESKET